MRSIVPLIVVLTLVAGCRDRQEPVTDPGDLPRLDERANRHEPSEAAQPREASPPAQADTQQADSDEQRAPDEFTVRLDTTEGPILIDVHREWAPHGADRFYTLVRDGYFQDVAFFRVVDGFMAQTGLHGDPQVNARWRTRRIPDDPPRQSNTRGMVSYAMGGPGTRTTQFFINYVDNSRLDSMGFAPFGRVRDMAPVDQLYSEYGESAPQGRGPVQARIQREGNVYLRQDFPELDYIQSASVVED